MKGQYDDADWSGLVSAIQVDVCSELEELRARVSGVRAAMDAMTLPAYVIAISLAIMAYRTF